MEDSRKPRKSNSCNFMRQFRDKNTRELKNLTASQFMEVWSHYDRDDESRFSLECDTRRVLVITGAYPHSFVKGHNTEELVGWYVNQHRWTYEPAYHSEWHFESYLRDTIVIPYAGAIGDPFVFQDDNAQPHRARLVENMLEAETIQRME
ncbi:hypothetical protein TNCV_4834921 [Trichonephila clavipes]|nr:hypothetical protein TNCV_4834921 [Trichonephila clavipes]